jgi:glyoxylase-like metal-dependent hydrolase (beta-lactamase superfamily II)
MQKECEVIMIPISFPFENPPSEGSAIEVAEDILWMRLPLPMALDHVNVYAIRDGEGWCIVDTGYFTKRSQKIWESLLSGPLNGKPVSYSSSSRSHWNGWMVSN